MNKLLIFVLIMVAVYWVRRGLSKPAAGSGDSRAAGADRKAEPEKMLACVHCGIHVPESEGVLDDRDFYCCAEHRRLHHLRH